MDKKDIIIILLAIAIILLLAMGAYHHSNENKELYHTVNISSTFSIDVPVSSNLSKDQISENMYIVNDSQNDIIIMSFDMDNASSMDLIEDGYKYYIQEESYKFKADDILNISNHTVWHDKGDNSYIAFFAPNNTKDNIMIVCHDNETMAHMIKTARY